MIIDGLKQGFIRNAEKGIPGGVASLDENGQIFQETIPPITASLVGAIALSEKGVTVATLVNGVIPDNQLPPIAITDTFVVVAEAAMLALTAQPGDVAVRTDALKTFILKSAPSSVLTNWIELPTPVDRILSINGKTGVVVLNAADVGSVATSEKGANNGLATLTSAGVIPNAQIPPLTYPVTSVNGQNGAVNLASGDVGAIALSQKGSTNGVAPLVNGVIPASHLTYPPTNVLMHSISNNAGGTAGQWVNMPAALTELFGNALFRQKFDLTNFTQFRILAQIIAVGFGSSLLRVQYSTDGITWLGLENGGNSNISVVLNSLGLVVSAWGNLVLARQDVFLRIAGSGGNGVADPVFGNISIQFK